MTEWIDNDAQMKEAYHTTELPETTTKGKKIDTDPEGRVLIYHDYENIMLIDNSFSID